MRALSPSASRLRGPRVKRLLLVACVAALLLVFAIAWLLRDPDAQRSAARALDGTAAIDASTSNALASGSTLQERRVAATALEVRVVDDLGARDGAYTLEARTANDELVTLDSPAGADVSFALPEGRWRILARARGNRSSVAEREIRAENEQAPLELVVPRPARISGSVRAASGVLTGAQVCLLVPEDAGFAPRSAPVDENGVFRFDDAPSGELVLRAIVIDAERGGASVPRTLRCSPNELVEGLELTLEPGATITAECVDSFGLAQPGYVVELRPWSTRCADDTRRAIADERGFVTFHGLLGGRFSLRKLAPDGTPSARLSADETSDGTAGSVHRLRDPRDAVAVRAGASIHHVLADLVSRVRVFGELPELAGRPGRRAIVRILSRGGDAPPAPVWTEVDEQCRFELGASPGERMIAVDIGGARLAARPLHVRAVPEQQVEIDLERCVLRGRVVGPDGAALPYANVHALPLRELATPTPIAWHESGGAQTDGEGRFEIHGLSPGRYSVRAAPRAGQLGHLGALGIEGVELREDVACPEVELRYDSTTRVRVTCLGPNGPLANASVSLLSASGRESAFVDTEARTDGNGELELTGVPAGRWHVNARADELVSAWSAPILLEHGATQELVLRLSASGRAHVQVVDMHGGTPQSAVTFLDERGLRVEPASIRPSNAIEHRERVNWRWTAVGLPLGRYRVIAALAEGISRGETTLDVLAGETSEVTVRVIE